MVRKGSAPLRDKTHDPYLVGLGPSHRRETLGNVGGGLSDPRQHPVLRQKAESPCDPLPFQSGVEILARPNLVKEGAVVRLLVAGVPRNAGILQHGQGSLINHPRRDHHGKSGGLRHRGHQLGQLFEVLTVQEGRVLTHGQIDEVNPRFRQSPGHIDDLVVGLSVPEGLRIGIPVETEEAIVAAVGAQVYEPVQEDGVARLPGPNPSGRSEERLPFLPAFDGEEVDDLQLRDGISLLGLPQDRFHPGSSPVGMRHD